MSILTWMKKEISDAAVYAYGEIASEPVLLKTDGQVLTYACDVKVDRPVFMPWIMATPEVLLHNVPIAVANRDLIYGAEIGNPVSLARNQATGRWEVVGFSKTKPGTYIRVAVDLDDGTADAAEDVTLTVRKLTLGELATLGGGFGTAPLGARGVFRGGALIEVRS